MIVGGMTKYVVLVSCSLLHCWEEVGEFRGTMLLLTVIKIADCSAFECEGGAQINFYRH